METNMRQHEFSALGQDQLEIASNIPVYLESTSATWIRDINSSVILSTDCNPTVTSANLTSDTGISQGHEPEMTVTSLQQPNLQELQEHVGQTIMSADGKDVWAPLSTIIDQGFSGDWSTNVNQVSALGQDQLQIASNIPVYQESTTWIRDIYNSGILSTDCNPTVTSANLSLDTGISKGHMPEMEAASLQQPNLQELQEHVGQTIMSADGKDVWVPLSTIIDLGVSEDWFSIMDKISALRQDQLQTATLVHMPQDISQASISNYLNDIDRFIMSTIDVNCKVTTEIISPETEISQEHLQDSIVGSFRHPHSQVVQEQVDQTINCNDCKDAWVTTSPIIDKGVPGLSSGNIKHIQDFSVVGFEEGQVQLVPDKEIIESTQLLQGCELAPKIITAVTPISHSLQQKSNLSPIQPVYGADIITQQLHDQSALNNSEVVSGIDNAAKSSTPTQQQLKLVSSGLDSETVISSSSTLAESPDPISGIHIGNTKKSTDCERPDREGGRIAMIEQHKRQFPGCNKGFRYMSQWRDHLSWHMEGERYTCPWKLCGKKFTRLDSFQRHCKIHTEERTFSCTECSKKYTRKGYLKRHEEDKHSEKKLHPKVLGEGQIFR